MSGRSAPDKTEKEQAVALHYDREKNAAPKIVAKGAGYIAEKIVSTAKQSAVPVYQNKSLTAMLMAMELDQEIPPSLYKAVAEVLAYVYHLDQNLGKKRH